MKQTVPVLLAGLTLLCSPVFGQQRGAVKRAVSRPAATVPEVKSDASAASEPVTNVVPYQKNDIVKVKTKIRYSTLIELPPSERILDFTCGDKDFWNVTGVQ